jgi:dolichol-phosphate mannosyltransferase
VGSLTHTQYSVLLTALNEVDSLEKTVKLISAELIQIPHEILISTSHTATPECLGKAEELSKKYTNVFIIFQKRENIGGSLLDSDLNAKGQFIIIMSSDGETDPKYLNAMIQNQKENLSDIVIGSRWLTGSKFIGYGFTKLVVNFLAQFTCRLLFDYKIKDWTYGYRLYKRDILNCHEYEFLNHAWFLESLLIASIDNKRITEIPVVWEKRAEGESTFKFKIYFDYISVIVKYFTKKFFV